MADRAISLGLDTAGNRWHLIGPAGIHHHCFLDDKKKPWKGDTDGRRIEMRTQFKATCAEIAAYGAAVGVPIHVFCEEPLAMRNGKVTRMLSLACGALWDVAVEFPLFWHWVNISHWKKEVIGGGNADKDQIAVWVDEHYPHVGAYVTNHETADYWDAAGLSVYGAQELTKQGFLPIAL